MLRKSSIHKGFIIQKRWRNDQSGLLTDWLIQRGQGGAKSCAETKIKICSVDWGKGKDVVPPQYVIAINRFTHLKGGCLMLG